MTNWNLLILQKLMKFNLTPLILSEQNDAKRLPQ